MFAELLKELFKETLADIIQISSLVLPIFVFLFTLKTIYRIFFPSVQTRKEEANIRLLEAKARLAEIQLAKAEAIEQMRLKMLEAQENGCETSKQEADNWALSAEELESLERELENELAAGQIQDSYVIFKRC